MTGPKFADKVRTRAYARCSYCGRYSDDPNTVGDHHQPLCDCGEQYGWSGSFVSPSADSQWSSSLNEPCQECGELICGCDCDRRAYTPEHVASADCWCEPHVEYRDPKTNVAVWVHKEIQ